MGEEDNLVPMVSVRIGKLNKRCQKKGIEPLQQNEVRKAVAKLGIGKCFNVYHYIIPDPIETVKKLKQKLNLLFRKEDWSSQVLLSQKKRVTPKGCLMIKRSLFQTKFLAALDRG